MFGLPVTVTGLLLLLTRILDAIDAPIWGSILDHTKSKYGKSRPYFLWLAVPFAVSFWLTFTTPSFLSEDGKIIYAIFTYLIAGIVYSGVQTAITSILPNLTQDHGERMVLNTFRMLGGSLGAFLCMSLTLPLVQILGGDDPQRGFSLTIGMFGIIVVVLLIFAFCHLREVNVERNVSIPVKDSLRAVVGNWPWILLVTANLIIWVNISVRQGTVIYFCKYTLGDENLASVMNAILMIGSTASFLTMSLVAGRLSKSGTMLLGALLVILGHGGIYFMGTNFSGIAVCWVLAALGQGYICGMPFGMLADTVDYGEWKTGIRAAGFLTAIGSALCIKAGSGLGGFIPTVVLDHYGYVANAEQTAESLQGISICFITIPVITAFLTMVPVFIYRRYEKLEERIVADLRARQSA